MYERGRERVGLAADRVVLATGGAGALWRHTTNPLGSWGRGLALAARAGAVLGDLEFMQFHPTAIDVGCDPMPLASEALRGEGAVLIDENGARFVDELLPRDIVSCAIWQHVALGHRVFLDARALDAFSQHFPSANALCLAGGVDPSCRPSPFVLPRIITWADRHRCQWAQLGQRAVGVWRGCLHGAARGQPSGEQQPAGSGFVRAERGVGYRRICCGCWRRRCERSRQATGYRF